MSEFVSCNCIEHEVVLDLKNTVRHCSNHNHNFGGRPLIYDYFDGNGLTKEDFFRRKWEFRKMFREGNVPEPCRECIHLIKKEWSDDNFINFILLTPWSECNSSCIYCPSVRDEDILHNTKKYDVYSVVKYMMENDIFIPETIFDFAGGEPTLYERFDDILELIFEKGYKNVVIHTNGIKFSPMIAKLLNHDKCKIVISIDSGNREIYKKIKQVDKFYTVRETLRKYSMAQAKKKNALRVKYILNPTINDENENITEFLDMCQSMGIRSVILNLDFNWIEKNTELARRQKDLPRSADNTTLKLYDLIDFTKTEARKRGITTSLYGEICTLKSIVEGYVEENIIEE